MNFIYMGQKSHILKSESQNKKFLAFFLIKYIIEPIKKANFIIFGLSDKKLQISYIYESKIAYLEI